MNPRTLHTIQKRLLNSRFFTISLLLHVLVVLTFGGTVLFNKYVEPPDFTAGEGGEGFVSNEAVTQPPPSPTTEKPPEITPTVAPSTPTINTIQTTNPTQSSFVLPPVFTPQMNATTTTLANQIQAPTGPKIGDQMTPQIAAGIRDFTQSWSTGGKGPGLGTSLRERTFQFTAFIAKYGDPNDPLGPDWNSTNWVRDGKIAGGSLINMLYVIDKLSSDKIHTTPDVVPLDLSNWDEIASKKPPFILFTGHRNFVLTDKEVENLQKYVRLGGCIWGDSSLPGNRSRFDIAFRREMKRVIPDVDKQFEPLPPNHPIFTRAYYPEIKSLPPGLNYYQEPVYALKIYGEIAILYTPNDYGDMWQMGLNEKMEIDMRKDEFNRYVAINWSMLIQSNTYYRNLTKESLVASYKFGTNIIVHLLTRWEDHVAKAPRGL